LNSSASSRAAWIASPSLAYSTPNDGAHDLSASGSPALYRSAS
jgi:hypothetical protein